MIKLNIHEAKTHLSKYLKRLKRGDVILICKRNIPIAEIRSLAAPYEHERPIGVGKGLFTIAQSFFEPLPDEILTKFSGQAN